MDNQLQHDESAQTNSKLWKEVLEELKVSISPANFNTWLSNTYIVSIKRIGDTRQIVEIGCPSTFVADAVEKRYYGQIQDALNNKTGLQNEISFVVSSLPSVKKTTQESPLFSFAEDKPKADINHLLKEARIRPGFTFENFAVSSSNQTAHAAAEAVSRSIGNAYNPLLLYGGVGIGKTHLMLAIGHRLLEQDPDAEVLYVMGEEFTSEIVEAIRNKTTQNFKKKYRNLKLLMLDDVQFLAGKLTVQEEFFHTFNTLLREGGQVVLTSDRPPSEIQRLEERLRSRFEAGLIIDISPPDFELRTAISLIKAQQKGVELSMESAQAIAANIDSPRRIEGFLTRLLTETNGFQEEITIELINRILGKTQDVQASFQQKRAVMPQVYIDAVANYYSLGKRKLLGDSRTRSIAFPRQVLMYLLREELKLPLQEVGHLVGGRDHTTVMHAVDKISKNISTDPKIHGDILGIKKIISG
jgi:chromosomal replication initiator protein